MIKVTLADEVFTVEAVERGGKMHVTCTQDLGDGPMTAKGVFTYSEFAALIYLMANADEPSDVAAALYAIVEPRIVDWGEVRPIP